MAAMNRGPSPPSKPRKRERLRGAGVVGVSGVRQADESWEQRVHGAGISGRKNSMSQDTGVSQSPAVRGWRVGRVVGDEAG